MEKLKMHTPDLAEENYKKLAALFPDAVTETTDENGNVVRAIDKDVLMQEINAQVVDDGQERYQFTWPDKRKSVMLANAPIAKTLRFEKEKSVGRDGTPGGTDSENIYIEGDNLDALKLLQETYLGKVKMIYIDPPYNTGNDFIYEDDFSRSAVDYADNSGQTDEDGNRLVQNSESRGRFHTDWLNMIYPRLKIAKDFLSDDGMIFISIDDNEQDNLKKICDEIFGAEKFIANFKWNRVKKAPSLSGSVRTKYEYVLAYYKSNRTGLYGKASYNRQGPLWHLPNKKQILTFPANSIRVNKDFPKGNYGGTYQVELLDDIICVNGLNENAVRIAACSAWGQDRINSYVAAGNTFEIKKGPTTVYTDLETENNFIAPSDLINSDECNVKTNTDANSEMDKLKIPFDYSKPVSLIQYLIKMATYKDNNSIILDFFSGSATTANAVLNLNAEDGGYRKFILVQLPEETEKKSEAHIAGYNTICDIGEERIRRAGKKIKEETGADIDYGFRCFKVDSSNMKDVYYCPAELGQTTLDQFTDNIKEDRTPEDLLIQVMLDLGVLLSSKVEQTEIAGKKVFSVADGYLIACFDQDVTDEVITAIAKRHPFYAVFRDSSMANDSVAANFEQIFETYSPQTVRKVL